MWANSDAQTRVDELGHVSRTLNYLPSLRNVELLFKKKMQTSGSSVNIGRSSETGSALANWAAGGQEERHPGCSLFGASDLLLPDVHPPHPPISPPAAPLTPLLGLYSHSYSPSLSHLHKRFLNGSNSTCSQ